MAKKPNPPTPPPAPAAAQPQPAAKTGRKKVEIQPEIFQEIETCKKRISSLKALNKLTPIIDGMDMDALGAIRKIIEGRAAKLSETK